MKNLSSPSLLLNPKHPKTETPESRQEEEKEGKNQLLLEDQDQLDQEDEDDKPRCEWDFNLSTVISSGAIEAVSDTLGAIEFDQSDRLLATGGIARKIRIYSINSLLPNEGQLENSYDVVSLLNHNNASEFYLCTPAKLSSLRWKPGSGGGILGSGDYDGVVMEYDLERRVPVFERDEHGGRRVWSMDYSCLDPVIGASGSDDGTMQIWDPRCDGGKCLAKVQPSVSRSPVCCVEFNPFSGAIVAVGCADSKVYGYDVRNLLEPLFILEGHEKAVTYIRFLNNHMIVTSAIDGSLKTWRTEERSLIKTFKGHVNSRRFVGLSVWRGGGLLSCGSEDNQVIVYDQRWGKPVWVHEFEPVAAPPPGGCGNGFVSSVCWRQVGEDRCTLVAGGSNGVLKVFSGRRRRR
ncbi:hypothetical protein M9H77_29917 [Catharanthus roseus]|uniref:Uncharacterized protein n=1 Tax=Catharanthus roseus TaxID=4058 RepID=A0ACB9ZXM2_CATRO|nr:hypothetical protein M9H77_29917 [Catharanthus roseus]